MKSKFTMLFLALALITFGGVAHAQLSDGDTIYCEKVIIPAAPWPDSVQVKVYIGTDNYLAAYQLGFRPMINGVVASVNDVQFTSQDFSTTALPAGGFLTPTLIDNGLNAILVGWTIFNPFGTPLALHGELTTLNLKIKNAALAPGTEITVDTVYVPPSGFVTVDLPITQGTSRGFSAPYDSKGGDHVRLPVFEYDSPVLPTSFALGQNTPNPFNPTTAIEFALPRAARTKIEIFNILGQKVKTLVDEDLTAGRKRVEWDGRDHTGRTVASGVYLYKMTANEFSETKKMLMMK